MRFQSCACFRRATRLVLGFLAATLGLSAAFAQQSSSPLALTQLARLGCETGVFLTGNVDLDTGYISMLGVSEKAYALRVLHNGGHALIIPAEQCRDPRSLEQRPFSFILSHAFQNKNQLREGYYYLINERGELTNAVHFQQGRSHAFAYANLVLPVRRADFEAEKVVWISKISSASVDR